MKTEGGSKPVALQSWRALRRVALLSLRSVSTRPRTGGADLTHLVGVIFCTVHAAKA